MFLKTFKVITCTKNYKEIISGIHSYYFWDTFILLDYPATIGLPSHSCIKYIYNYSSVLLNRGMITELGSLGSTTG